MTIGLLILQLKKEDLLLRFVQMSNWYLIKILKVPKMCFSDDVLPDGCIVKKDEVGVKMHLNLNHKDGLITMVASI
ncbi:hypothetical protein Tco_1358089 [Tanacetum coccineum]